MKKYHQKTSVELLLEEGFTYDDATALRRISMTFQRWFELECGNSNDYCSWAIERDEATDKPFMMSHYYRQDYTTRMAIPDREKGARKRLAAIMQRYPNYVAYVQTDPRGTSLYILRPRDIIPGGDVSTYYSRGIAVYK